MNWLILISALLAAGGGVAAYFIIKKRRKNDTTDAPSDAPSEPAVYDRDKREATILAQKAELAPGAVVFIGDSITEGLPIPPAPFLAFNAAISGACTVTYSLFLPKLLDGLKAKLVVIALGVNDAYNIKRFFGTYRAICDAIEVTGARIAVATVLPVVDGIANPDYTLGSTHVNVEAIKEENGYIRGLAQNRGYAFLDSFAALADASGHLPSRYSYDGLHLNATGNERLKAFYIAAIASLAG